MATMMTESTQATSSKIFEGSVNTICISGHDLNWFAEDGVVYIMASQGFELFTSTEDEVHYKNCHDKMQFTNARIGCDIVNFVATGEFCHAVRKFFSNDGHLHWASLSETLDLPKSPGKVSLSCPAMVPGDDNIMTKKHDSKPATPQPSARAGAMPGKSAPPTASDVFDCIVYTIDISGKELMWLDKAGVGYIMASQAFAVFVGSRYGGAYRSCIEKLKSVLVKVGRNTVKFIAAGEFYDVALKHITADGRALWASLSAALKTAKSTGIPLVAPAMEHDGYNVRTKQHDFKPVSSLPILPAEAPSTSPRHPIGGDERKRQPSTPTDARCPSFQDPVFNEKRQHSSLYANDPSLDERCKSSFPSKKRHTDNEETSLPNVHPKHHEDSSTQGYHVSLNKCLSIANKVYDDVNHGPGPTPEWASRHLMEVVKNVSSIEYLHKLHSVSPCSSRKGSDDVEESNPSNKDQVSNAKELEEEEDRGV
jgi:hypothetical protein